MASLSGMGSFITLKQGAKMASRPTFVKSLSNNAIPGRTYRLFFPKVKRQVEDEYGNPMGESEDNFMMAYVVGRDLDMNVFNHVSFMTYKQEWFEMLDTNTFKDLTGVNSYFRIMRAAFEASCEKEKADAEQQSKELAAQNGGKIDERALFRKLDNIDMRYHGRPAEDGVPAVYASVKPAIGSLHGMLITECLRVPMKTDTNTPDWANASCHYKKCSKKFIQQLIDIMDDPAYNRSDADYIEITYKYGSDGQKPSEAGRDSTFTPVSRDLALETLYPSEWESIGREKVNKVAGGDRDAAAAADAVLKESGYGSVRITPQELASTVKKWASTNMVIFTKMNLEAQETVKAAKDLVSCGILDGLADIKAKVEQMAEEQGEDSEENGTQTTAAAESKSETQASTPIDVEQPATPVDPEHEKRVSEAVQELYNTNAIDGRTANQYLDIPDDDDDGLMGDII